MIGLKGRLNVIDNSGATLVECIQVLRAGSHARIGDEIVCVVQRSRTVGVTQGNQQSQQKVKRGDVRHALVVRTKKEVRRPDGRYIKFDDNACVLINNKGEPLGSRILGIVGAELRDKGKYSKILTLAQRVV
ncbi:54S ribosomal protein L12, mitochondrial [Savitreella phatthalungensis]